jgi:hypothetical protein
MCFCLAHIPSLGIRSFAKQKQTLQRYKINVIAIKNVQTGDANLRERTPKTKSGRPPKFQGPRRPVTVTLPESTLARLASINEDRARAIVMLTEAALPDDEKEKHVEIVEVASGVGVIIVGPSRLLSRVEGLRLVQLSPMRYLLTIPSGTTIASFELAVLDLIEEAKSEHNREQSLLTQLRELIRRLRRDDCLFKAEMLFIDIGRFNNGADGQTAHLRLG